MHICNAYIRNKSYIYGMHVFCTLHKLVLQDNSIHVIQKSRTVFGLCKKQARNTRIIHVYTRWYANDYNCTLPISNMLTFCIRL